jgi:hypothetical protein
MCGTKPGSTPRSTAIGGCLRFLTVGSTYEDKCRADRGSYGGQVAWPPSQK